MIIATQHVGHSGGVANIKDRRSRSEERAQVVDGTQGRAGHAEGDQRRRVAMHNSLNVGTRPINSRVNETLEVNGAPSRIDRRALQVEFENILSCDQTRRHAARQQKLCRVLLVANADVAETVEHALVVEDPISVDQILDKARLLSTRW